MEYRLTLPYTKPPLTTNESRNAHHFTEHRVKKQVEEMVGWAAKQAKVPALGPSTITAVWYAPDRRIRDNDSLAMLLKATKDGLVKAGVWPGDHWAWVVEDRMAVTVTDTKNPRIEIIIREVEPNDHHY